MNARRHENSLRVYKDKHEKRNSVSTSSHVAFCLYINITKGSSLTVFRRCPKARQTFPKVSEVYRRFPKRNEFSKEDPMMFDQAATYLLSNQW